MVECKVFFVVDFCGRESVDESGTFGNVGERPYVETIEVLGSDVLGAANVGVERDFCAVVDHLYTVVGTRGGQ